MTLSYNLESIDELDENVKGLYKESDNERYKGFILDVEGVKPMSEFNTVWEVKEKEKKAHKEAAAKLREFGEYTPQTIQELLNKNADLELAVKGNTNEDLQKRLDEALKVKTAPFIKKEQEYSTLIESLKNEVNNYKQEKTISTLQQKINNEITKKDSKFRPEAAKDIFARAMMPGGLTFNEDVGDFTDKEGNTFDYWMIKESQDSLWLKSSQGAGATGGKTGATSNPWLAGSENYTEQSRILNENPGLAERLKKQAGK